MIKYPRTHTVDNHLQIQYEGSMVRYISDDQMRIIREKQIMDLYHLTSQLTEYGDSDFEFHFWTS